MNVSDHHADVLTELVNIGVGRAAAQLNEMLACPVQLRVPYAEIVGSGTLADYLELDATSSLTSVELRFTSPFCGTSLLAMDLERAHQLSGILLEEPGPPPEAHRATFTEVGNILLNSLLGSVSNLLGTSLEYQVPLFHEGAPTQRPLQAMKGILAGANMRVRDLALEGHVLLLFDHDALQEVLEAIDRLEASKSGVA